MGVDDTRHRVTVVVPARNEQDSIGACLRSIRRQDHRDLEILVVDGASEDATAAEVRSHQAEDGRVRLLQNPDRIVSTALNVALAEATGRWFVRVDAHATVPPDYITRAVAHLATGRWGGVGGRKDAVGVTAAGRAIAAAMGSRFGVGGSVYHHGIAPRTVDHVPFGAYPTDLARRLGGWDPAVVTNQDFEFDRRVRAAGYELLFDPALRIDWSCRQRIVDLCRQYHRYGRGKVLVGALHPGSVRPRHLAAPALVVLLGVASAVAPWRRRVAAALLLPYVVATAAASAVTARRVAGARARLLVPAAFVSMHVAWGTGFWRGLPAAARERRRRTRTTGAKGACDGSRVVLVGRGAPERGGIPSVLASLEGSELGRSRPVVLCNLARPTVRAGGRITVGNFRRVAADVAAVSGTVRRGDIVHVHSAFAPTVTALRAGALVATARARGARTVLHVHGGRVIEWLGSPPARRIARAVLATADRVVTASHEVRSALTAIVPPDSVEVVWNGVDVDRFAPVDERHDPPRILFVGGLTPRKGLKDLFAASRLLERRGVAHQLLVVGGTPDDGAVAEGAVRAEAPPSVRFLGTLAPEEMPGVYRSADVFCLPSWWEAMPLSIIEALASGLPVVASRVGDVPRMVRDGETGLLVPPRDPAALAAALAVILGDPGRWRDMGTAARQDAVARFGLEGTVAALEEVYAALCNSSSDSGGREAQR